MTRTAARERGWGRGGDASKLGDDEGTMSLLLMVVVVCFALSALIVPMVITQNRATRFDSTRVQSLDAAQAGVDVTLGLIRGAVGLSGAVSWGDSTKLPCGPLSGIVDGNAAAAYNVKIEYFTFDPVREPDVTTRNMNCVAGYGVYDPTARSYSPGYARITSTGTVGSSVNGSSAGRTLVTTYVFKTTLSGVPGGTIGIGTSTPAGLCMDVGSATATAGTAVVLQNCSTSTPVLAQQSFVYRTDLTLQLQAPVSAAYPNGLCLAPSTTPPASGNGVQLASCSPLGSPPYNQQWSFNVGKFQASTANSATDGGLPDLCLTASPQAAGAPLTLVSCASAASWVPATGVGVGGPAGASPANGQIPPGPQRVNFSEYSRCLDINGADPNTNHLIDYPCKLNPSYSAVGWNQKFNGPTITGSQTSVTGQLSATVGGTSPNYCLTSPGTNGGYVTMGPQGSGGVQPCGSGGATQTWTVYGGDRSLTYATKYTIVDSSGLCLGLTTPVGGEAWAAVDVETCTGSAEQKWNVNPNVLNPALQNTREK